MEKKTYSEKLRDPKWQKKRLKILERDNWACTICGNTEETLHVHHLSYDGNPWDVDDKVLRTLCESCHQVQSDIVEEDFLFGCALFRGIGLCDSEFLELIDRVIWKICESKNKLEGYENLMKVINPTKKRGSKVLWLKVNRDQEYGKKIS